MMLLGNISRAALTVFMLFVIVHVLAQECATIPTDDQVSYTRSFKLQETRNLKVTKGIVDIPLQIYIISDDNGEGGMNPQLLQKYIDHLNEIYLEANLRFVQNQEYIKIENSKFFNFNIKIEEDLASNYHVENAINIYVPKTIIGGYYGYTYHPEKAHKNRMVISQDGFKNGSTFPHEMGHFFGLYHTHGKGNVENKKEPIERGADLNNNGIIDCYETGDDLCDTPADPNLGLEEYRDYCMDNCEMNNKIPSDVNGTFYEPQITNIMCYNQHASCRREFTPEQLTRIFQTARSERKSLRKQKPKDQAPIRGSIAFNLKNGRKMPLSLDINLYSFERSYSTLDTFYFEIENRSTKKIHLAIINMDTRNNVNKVYPFQGDLPYILANESVNPLNGYITLDRTEGKEYTCILISRATMDVDRLVKQMRFKSGTFTQRIYKSMGNKLLPLDHVSYNASQKIDFDAVLAADEVLPIMIEMEHGY